MEQNKLPDTLRISKESRVPLWCLDAAGCALSIATLLLYAVVVIWVLNLYSSYTELLEESKCSDCLLVKHTH